MKDEHNCLRSSLNANTVPAAQGLRMWRFHSRFLSDFILARLGLSTNVPQHYSALSKNWASRRMVAVMIEARLAWPGFDSEWFSNA